MRFSHCVIGACLMAAGHARPHACKAVRPVTTTSVVWVDAPGETATSGASVKSVSSSGVTTPASSVASSANTTVSVSTGSPAISSSSTLSTIFTPSNSAAATPASTTSASASESSAQTVSASSNTSTTSGPAETTNTSEAPEASTSASSSSSSSVDAAPTTATTSEAVTSASTSTSTSSSVSSDAATPTTPAPAATTSASSSSSSSAAAPTTTAATSAPAPSPITSRAYPADMVDKLRDSSFSKLESFSAKNVASGGCTLQNAAIRYEWSDLSVPQREEYIAAVKCLMNKPTKLSASEAPGAKSRYDDFLVAHIQQTPNIHSTANFLTWHRYFTWAFEQALRNECGYTGYQPYWNWDRYAKDPENSPLFNGNASSLSGNSPRPGACVETGPFADMKVNLGPGSSLRYNPRCLKRAISKSNAAQTTADKTYALITRSNDITSFQNTMQNPSGVHAMGHFTVGGDPGGDIYTSPGDIYFYAHHAMVDRVYWIWQMQDLNNRLNSVGGNTGAGRPGSRDDLVNLGVNGGDVKLGSLLNTLGGKGGEFCYIYM